MSLCMAEEESGPKRADTNCFRVHIVNLAIRLVSTENLEENRGRRGLNTLVGRYSLAIFSNSD